MKPVVFALAALALATGAANASSQGPIAGSERSATPVVTVEVPAGDVMTTRELSQAGLSADDLVQVTKAQSPEGEVDNSSRGFY